MRYGNCLLIRSVHNFVSLWKDTTKMLNLNLHLNNIVIQVGPQQPPSPVPSLSFTSVHNTNKHTIGGDKHNRPTLTIGGDTQQTHTHHRRRYTTDTHTP